MTRLTDWHWLAVALAFPISGYIGWKIGGPVDATASALIGGALTGAGVGAVQCWATRARLGRPVAWIGASALGYGVGLAAGAGLVGYETGLGSLVLMGAVSGAVLGAAQAAVLARGGRRGLAAVWALAMPVLFALCWVPTNAVGVEVENQFTVFGAAGSFSFMLLSGLLLARATRTGAPATR